MSRPCTNKKEEVQSACDHNNAPKKKKSISEVIGQRRPGRGFEKSYARGADILTSNTTHRMQPYRNLTDSVQTGAQRLSKEDTMLPLPTLRRVARTYFSPTHKGLQSNHQDFSHLASASL